MVIKELKLENFRSYEFLEMPLNSGINLIYGGNGSGKSTIIESIYYALSGKSFRTTETNNLIRENTNLLQALLSFDDGKSIKVTKKANTRPIITQNKGQKRENYTSLVKKYPTCLIENKEFFFTSSNPEQKRTYLNKTLFYVEQSEFKRINDLKKIIVQRAGCLKTKDFNQIKYWDEQLINIEPEITLFNMEICKKINSLLKNSEIIDCFVNKNPWLVDLSIKYQHGFNENEQFSTILTNNLEKDMVLKRTSAGPHKRSFEILLENKSSDEVLSRGQQKIISIILHLIQREIIRSHTDMEPILLMDDISSELDKENANLMLKYLIDKRVQTIMTSIEKSHFEAQKDVFLFHVEHKGEASHVK